MSQIQYSLLETPTAIVSPKAVSGPVCESTILELAVGKHSGVRTKPLARRTLTRYVIWQANCDVAAQTTRSNLAVLRVTISIEYPISNCPAKSRAPARSPVGASTPATIRGVPARTASVGYTTPHLTKPRRDSRCILGLVTFPKG